MEGIGSFALIALFAVGYLLITLEFAIKINRTAVVLLLTAACWLLYFFSTGETFSLALLHLQTAVSDSMQIILFFLGAMTLVELIDSHKGFKILVDLIRTTSKRKMLWAVALFSFFLSAILDNLTCAILMISLLRRMIPRFEDRLAPACLVVIAANAGGAWTPIGDITTTMLWIGGQLSTLSVIKNLFLPSLVSLLVPLGIFSITEKGRISPPAEGWKEAKEEPGARLIFYLGVTGLLFVPLFHALTGLPPFLGMFISLAVLWVVTDFMHHKHEERKHLRVPFILTKIDMTSILFFLGVLLSMYTLDAAGVLHQLEIFLSRTFHHPGGLATVLGLTSAVIDNVPLVAATMSMYSLEQYPMDSALWQMIAYAAGTGGSLLLIGSAAGIALMGMERVGFFTYLKKATLPVLLGFFIGMAVYFFFSGEIVQF